MSRTFVLGWGRKICSHSPKMYQNSPTAMQNFKNFPVTIHRTPVLGERKVGFISSKMYQHAPTTMQNYKKNPELLDPRFWEGEGKVASS